MRVKDGKERRYVFGNKRAQRGEEKEDEVMEQLLAKKKEQLSVSHAWVNVRGGLRVFSVYFWQSEGFDPEE